MSLKVSFPAFAVLALLSIAAIGCSESSTMDAQQLAAYRTELTLNEEPDGIQTVADVRLTLLGETSAPVDDHDHDGDGEPDHAAEDHDEHAEDHDDDHQGDSSEHAGHDHDGHDHDGHTSHDHAHETQAVEVVMLGNIGGLANPWADTHREYPFAKTKAVIYLADPEAVIENEEAGHKHAPGEECAFCAAHAADKADKLAIVQFVDEKGKVLPTDARQLFDVKEQDSVVVSGKARVTAGGILVVEARGLYVRK